MITVNINKGKRLEFTYAVANVHPENIHGKFVIEYSGLTLSYPIKIKDGNKIIVEIIPNKLLRQLSGVVKARLEIIAAGDTLLIPWTDSLEIQRESTAKIESRKEEDISPLLEKLIRAKSLVKGKEVKREEKRIVEEEEIVEEENIFGDFLNTPVEDMLYTQDQLREKKEREDQFAGILDISMDELVKKVK